MKAIFVLSCEAKNKTHYANVLVTYSVLDYALCRQVEEEVKQYKSYDRCCLVNVIKLDSIDELTCSITITSKEITNEQE